MPQRIQRRRSKGWRKPAGAVNVTRPSKWGNPFPLRHGAFARERNKCKSLYLTHLARELDAGRLDLEELRGRDLMCWCALDAEWCHADELLAMANQMTYSHTLGG